MSERRTAYSALMHLAWAVANLYGYDSQAAQWLFEEIDEAAEDYERAGVVPWQLEILHDLEDAYKTKRLAYLKSPGSVQHDLAIRRDAWTENDEPIVKWRRRDVISESEVVA